MNIRISVSTKDELLSLARSVGRLGDFNDDKIQSMITSISHNEFISSISNKTKTGILGVRYLPNTKVYVLEVDIFSKAIEDTIIHGLEEESLYVSERLFGLHKNPDTVNSNVADPPTTDPLLNALLNGESTKDVPIGEGGIAYITEGAPPLFPLKKPVPPEPKFTTERLGAPFKLLWVNKKESDEIDVNDVYHKEDNMI